MARPPRRVALRRRRGHDGPVLTLTHAVEAQEASAVARTGGARRPLASSMLAGAYIGLGGIFMLVAAGPLKAVGSPLVPIVSGLTFCLGLTLCVFGGGELGTSAMMTFGFGAARRRFGWPRAGGILLFMLLGNLVGAIVLSAIIGGTHILDPSTPGGAMLAGVVTAKQSLPASVIFFRGIMCNVLVCLTIWCTTRLESEIGKAIAIFMIISAFVACGFEHVVANMSFFGLGIACGVDGASVGLMARNLLISGLGNTVGGLLVAGAFLAAHRTEGATAPRA